MLKKEPPYAEAQRCLEIRKIAKSSGRVTAEEINFCAQMLKKYPEWYESTVGEVYDATVPFGSNVKWTDGRPSKKKEGTDA
jgi:hypothetical protein